MKTWETEDQLDRDERFVSARQNANARQVGGTHYVDMAVQPWEVMEAVLSRPEFIGYLRGCIIKYGMRQGKKEGSDDGGKLAHYIEKYKEVIGKYEDSF